MGFVEIEKHAKKVMDEFASALNGVEYVEKDLKVIKSQGFRDETECFFHDCLFREMMLSNAFETAEGFILSEKKKW